MDTSPLIKQLDTILEKVARLNTQYSDLYTIPEQSLQGIITLALAAIDRIAGPDSS